MDYEVHITTDSGKPREEHEYFRVHLSNPLENCMLGTADRCVKCGKNKLGQLVPAAPFKWEHICYDCMSGK
jgi:hypothetical protein